MKRLASFFHRILCATPGAAEAGEAQHAPEDAPQEATQDRLENTTEEPPIEAPRTENQRKRDKQRRRRAGAREEEEAMGITQEQKQNKGPKKLKEEFPGQRPTQKKEPGRRQPASTADVFSNLVLQQKPVPSPKDRGNDHTVSEESAGPHVGNDDHVIARQSIDERGSVGPWDEYNDTSEDRDAAEEENAGAIAPAPAPGPDGGVAEALVGGDGYAPLFNDDGAGYHDDEQDPDDGKKSGFPPAYNGTFGTFGSKAASAAPRRDQAPPATMQSRAQETLSIAEENQNTPEEVSLGAADVLDTNSHSTPDDIPLQRPNAQAVSQQTQPAPATSALNPSASTYIPRGTAAGFSNETHTHTQSELTGDFNINFMLRKTVKRANYFWQGTGRPTEKHHAELEKALREALRYLCRLDTKELTQQLSKAIKEQRVVS